VELPIGFGLCYRLDQVVVQPFGQCSEEPEHFSWRYFEWRGRKMIVLNALRQIVRLVCKSSRWGDRAGRHDGGVWSLEKALFRQANELWIHSGIDRVVVETQVDEFRMRDHIEVQQNRRIRYEEIRTP